MGLEKSGATGIVTETGVLKSRRGLRSGIKGGRACCSVVLNVRLLGDVVVRGNDGYWVKNFVES